MRHVKKTEKGILQFCNSTDSKFAAAKKTLEAKQPALIQNVVLQQKFDTLQAKKHEKELARLKGVAVSDTDEDSEGDYENMDPRQRKLKKLARVAADKRKQE